MPSQPPAQGRRIAHQPALLQSPGLAPGASWEESTARLEGGLTRATGGFRTASRRAPARGMLDLRLRHLDVVVARRLGTCSGVLEFSVLESLAPDAAAALVGRRDVLRLNAVTRLNAQTAHWLARSECDLQLKGLTQLKPGVAAALAGHRGSLCLDNLKTRSAEDARHLAWHEGELCLNGLITL